jgi:hypothetical protein
LPARFSLPVEAPRCGSATGHIRVFCGPRFGPVRWPSPLIRCWLERNRKVWPNLPAKDYSVDNTAGCFGRDLVLSTWARCRSAYACRQGSGGYYRFYGGHSGAGRTILNRFVCGSISIGIPTGQFGAMPASRRPHLRASRWPGSPPNRTTPFEQSVWAKLLSRSYADDRRGS